jgi:flagellar assembly protein FliH
LSEVVRIRRIPRSRVKLIRVHAAQPAPAEHIVPTADVLDPFGPATPFPEVAAVPLDTTPNPADVLAQAYERGEQEGRRVAEEEFKEALARLREEEAQRIGSVLSSITTQMQEMQKTIERDAYRFALAVAERVVKHEVTLHDDAVIAQIREAIQRVVGVESIKLRVHPADEDIVRAHRNTLLASLGTVHEVVIDADEGMERGGCIIDSASGNIDARISTQMKQIDAALFGPAAGRGEAGV